MIHSDISLFLLLMCVFGADEEERVSVMEGHSVTLDSDFREDFSLIQWRFEGSLIAETKGNQISYIDERFIDRVKLNYLTGSLTINNIRLSDTGLYGLSIYHRAGVLYKTFSVTVNVFGADEGKTVSVMEGHSVTLRSNIQTNGFNKIQWYFRDVVIAVFSLTDKSISYPSERFKDRLNLNDQNRSLTINNTRITDSGGYKLEISHNDGTSKQTFNVIVHGSAQFSGLEAGIVVVLLLVCFGAAGVFCYYHKICKRERQNQSVTAENQTDYEMEDLDHQTGSLKTTESRDYEPSSEDICCKAGVELSGLKETFLDNQHLNVLLHK